MFCKIQKSTTNLSLSNIVYCPLLLPFVHSLHNRLRCPIGMLNVQKKSKSKRLFLTLYIPKLLVPSWLDTWKTIYSHPIMSVVKTKQKKIRALPRRYSWHFEILNYNILKWLIGNNFWLMIQPALRISFDDISFCRYCVIFKISLKYCYRIFFENITQYLIMKYWSILAFQ